MGRSNRERRAAKAKARQRARSADGQHGRVAPPRDRVGGGIGPGFDAPRAGPGAGRQLDPDELAVDALREAVLQRRNRGATAPRLMRELGELPGSAVDRAAEALLLELVDLLWGNGWQPAELHRQGRRGPSTAAGGRLVAQAIAVDHVGRRSVTLHPRWVAQVESLDLPPTDGRPGWVRRWARDERLEATRAHATVVEVLADLYGLPRLDAVLPPPGSGHDGRDRPPPVDPVDVVMGAETDPVLQRIRALLAQAESTSFEAEAEVFTAKAQELMTRHAVDAAMVAAGSAESARAEPVAVRVPIDAPYADAKSLLLQFVAEATRCRSVHMGAVGLSTVIGFPDDVAAVELLFTSLLLQAQRALSEASAAAPAGGRVRRPSYRSAFLLAYADRIGDRLDEINRAVYAQAERVDGPAFLPVLRSRQDAIDDYVRGQFGELQSSRVRGGDDALGWAGGRSAADRAKLNAGDLDADSGQSSLPSAG